VPTAATPFSKISYSKKRAAAATNKKEKPDFTVFRTRLQHSQSINNHKIKQHQLNYIMSDSDDIKEKKGRKKHKNYRYKREVDDDDDDANKRSDKKKKAKKIMSDSDDSHEKKGRKKNKRDVNDDDDDRHSNKKKKARKVMSDSEDSREKKGRKKNKRDDNDVDDDRHKRSDKKKTSSKKHKGKHRRKHRRHKDTDEQGQYGSQQTLLLAQTTYTNPASTPEEKAQAEAQIKAYGPKDTDEQGLQGRRRLSIWAKATLLNPAITDEEREKAEAQLKAAETDESATAPQKGSKEDQTGTSNKNDGGNKKKTKQATLRGTQSDHKPRSPRSQKTRKPAPTYTNPEPQIKAYGPKDTDEQGLQEQRRLSISTLLNPAITDVEWDKAEAQLVAAQTAESPTAPPKGPKEDQTGTSNKNDGGNKKKTKQATLRGTQSDHKPRSPRSQKQRKPTRKSATSADIAAALLESNPSWKSSVKKKTATSPNIDQQGIGNDESKKRQATCKSCDCEHSLTMYIIDLTHSLHSAALLRNMVEMYRRTKSRLVRQTIFRRRKRKRIRRH
jgi:hypothetical protein